MPSQIVFFGRTTTRVLSCTRVIRNCDYRIAGTSIALSLSPKARFLGKAGTRERRKYKVVANKRQRRLSVARETIFIYVPLKQGAERVAEPFFFLSLHAFFCCCARPGGSPRNSLPTRRRPLPSRSGAKCRWSGGQIGSGINASERNRRPRDVVPISTRD